MSLRNKNNRPPMIRKQLQLESLESRRLMAGIADLLEVAKPLTESTWGMIVKSPVQPPEFAEVAMPEAGPSMVQDSPGASGNGFGSAKNAMAPDRAAAPDPQFISSVRPIKGPRLQPCPPSLTGQRETLTAQTNQEARS